MKFVITHNNLTGEGPQISNLKEEALKVTSKEVEDLEIENKLLRQRNLAK